MRKKKQPKKQSNRLRDFIFMNTWVHKGPSKAFLEKLTNEFLEFYEDPSRLTFEEFYESRGITTKTFSDWMAKCPDLKEAHTYIKMVLAGRREKGMLIGTIKEKSAMHVQHKYSERWREADLYWSELRKKDEDQKQDITVVIPPLKTEDKKTNDEKV